MKRNQGLDLMKAICSFLVVCIHAQFPVPPYGAAIAMLSRVAVPLFFMVTGYYYTHTKQRQYEKKQLSKILRLVVISSLLYLGWNLCLSWERDGSIGAGLLFLLDGKSWLRSLFFNTSPFEGHLWYLNAILYVLLMVVLFEKKWSRQKLYPLIPVLLLSNLILGAYAPVIFGKPLEIWISRNFLFTGLPYFLIGDMICTRKIKMKTNTALILGVMFTLLAVLESFLLDSLDSDRIKDHYCGTAFSAVFLFLFALQCNVKTGPVCNRVLGYIGAKLSTSIYILHMMMNVVFGVAVDFFGSYLKPLYGLFYIRPVAVFVLTVIVAWVWQWIITGFRAKFCAAQGETPAVKPK